MNEKDLYIAIGFLSYLVIMGTYLILRKDPVNIFYEKNLRRGVILLLITTIMAIYFGISIAIGLYLLLIIGNELIAYFFGHDFIWDNESSVRLLYTLPDEGGRDLGNKSEACYDEENTLPAEAQINRFKKTISLLGLKQGDRVLDIGCGEGEFVQYCQDVGIKAQGLTLVEGQAVRAQKLGRNVIVGSYHNLHESLIGQFDAVVFMGSLEHAVANGHHKSVFVRMSKTYKNIFNNVRLYLDKNSAIRRVYTSTLHANPKYLGTFGTFVFARAYGGAYPLDKEGMRISDYTNTKLIHRSDHTLDYYQATAFHPTHFGHTRVGSFSSYLAGLALFPIYPRIIYMILYDFFGLWMWQFSGQFHFTRNYIFTDHADQRPATLYWSVVQY